jgi:hypothetical protein
MTNINSIRKNLSIVEIAVSIIVLVLLNISVIMLANYRDNTIFYKLLYTARLTLFLFNIALCLFILPGSSETRMKFWLLFWTGSFISFLIHIYFSYFIFFGGSIAKFYDSQGVFVATLNLLITFWWLLDIILSWTSNSNSKWIMVQKTGIHILLFATFFSSTVIFHAVDNKEIFVVVMGALLGISALVCLYIRIRFYTKKTVLSNKQI